MSPSPLPTSTGEEDIYGYGDATPDSAGAADYGYGDATPDTGVDYGYGDATPYSSATSAGDDDHTDDPAVDYGYGDATPDTAVDYGYGDATPDTAVDYGYGDAAPGSHYQTELPELKGDDHDDHDGNVSPRQHRPKTRRTRDVQRHVPDRSKSDDILYHPDYNDELADTGGGRGGGEREGGGSPGYGGGGSPRQGGRQRYRRRGSVTRYSLVASNEVIEEFTEAANLIDQFRNMQVNTATSNANANAGTDGGGGGGGGGSGNGPTACGDTAAIRSHPPLPSSPLPPSSPSMSGSLSPGKPFNGEWKTNQSNIQIMNQDGSDNREEESPRTPSHQDPKKKKKKHLRLVKKMRRRFSTTA
mmetsp:Transcript_21326/g.50686  ORF Transcript_21326/g.50686 Transcript_21326/m.50686 type:complete len:358 (+) Transcript_21326:483-1556(+)